MRVKRWVSVLSLSLGLVSVSYAVEDDFWLDVENNRSQAVLRYLAQGIDPNIKSREEQPAIMWAIQNQAWAVYDLLLAHRQFDPNVTNAHDETPLMYLAILGEDKRGAELIAKGAQVHRLGWTPLHYAASKAQVAMAELLLKQGALVNAPAPDGTTALMMAARSGNRPMVDLLLRQGADPTVQSLGQLSAADWAEANQHTQIAEQLRQLALRYDHSRPTRSGLTDSAHKQMAQPPALVAPAAADTTEAASASGGSQYFDLKRFD